MKRYKNKHQRTLTVHRRTTQTFSDESWWNRTLNRFPSWEIKQQNPATDCEQMILGVFQQPQTVHQPNQHLQIQTTRNVTRTYHIPKTVEGCDGEGSAADEVYFIDSGTCLHSSPTLYWVRRIVTSTFISISSTNKANPFQCTVNFYCACLWAIPREQDHWHLYSLYVYAPVCIPYQAGTLKPSKIDNPKALGTHSEMTSAPWASLSRSWGCPNLRQPSAGSTVKSSYSHHSPPLALLTPQQWNLIHTTNA